MLNDVFTDRQTGEQVKVINEDTNFYELDNSVRIKKDVFHKKYEQKVEVNPTTFFQQKYTTNDPIANLANQIKNLDTTKISDTDAPARIKYTPPVVLADSSLPPGGVIRQQQTDEPIHLTPEQKKAMLDDWRKTQPGAQVPEVQQRNWDDVEDERFLNGDKPITPKAPEPPKVNPLEMMFNMFKNNYSVKLNLEVEDNIPNPQIMSIIQENADADAIEYYAGKITDKILKDPSILKKEVYNQLKSIINKELGVE